MHDDGYQILLTRGKKALKLGLTVLTACTAAYYLVGCLIGMNAGYGRSFWSLEDDLWQWDECLYATGITLTTVGYTDLLGTEKAVFYTDGQGRYRLDSNMDGYADEGYDESTETLVADWTTFTRILTVAQVIVGISFFLYVIAQLTAFFAEGGYEEIAAARRNRFLIARFRDHVILCGCGGPGLHTALELFRAGVTFVCLERSAESLARLQRMIKDLRRTQPGLRRRRFVYLRGDAHDDGTLRAAGVERARSFCAALPQDKDNLILTVTARQMNPTLRIVARGVEEFHAFGRLGKAGAQQVVSANFMGGLRIASELVRPAVVAFLDVPLYGGAQAPVQIESVRVSERSPLAGRTLGESRFEAQSGHQVLAIHAPDDSWSFNPGPDAPLAAGAEVVVVCDAASIVRVRALLDPGAPGVPGASPPPTGAPR